ncbi:MAG: ABC transporter permease [Elusimicrobia bacterium]|nr:ABC transporter permease [Elusimicrobiota bacterium]
MARPGFRSQLDILTDRALAVHAGAPGALLALLVQAPAIGAFIGLAWRSAEPTPAVHFVMTIAALWMGCMNSCTAIVQERAVFDRERMFELDIRAYLLSKMSVLTALAALQALLLLVSAGNLMHLPSSWVSRALYFIALTATGTAASALGLAVSAFSRSPQGAVVAVPILLIPQVVFSRLLLQEAVERTVPKAIHRLTLTKWCYDALETARNDIEWTDQGAAVLFLGLWTAVLLSVAAAKLRWDDA